MKELEDIKNLVIQFSGCDDFEKQSRKRNLVYLRYVYMSLCRNYTIMSLESIGEVIGGRNHATVLHGVNAFYDHYGKDYFQGYQDIYLDCANVLESNGKKELDIVKVKESSIAEYRIKYRLRFLKFVLNQKPLIESLKKKIKVFRYNDIFHELALLSDEDMEDFETRSRAFLAMKKLNNSLKKTA